MKPIKYTYATTTSAPGEYLRVYADDDATAIGSVMKRLAPGEQVLWIAQHSPDRNHLRLIYLIEEQNRP